MDKKKIIQSLFLLLPAGVVGIACTLGLSLHPADIVATDNITEVSQASDDTSELNSVVETAQPEEVSRKTDTSSLTQETLPSESSRTSSSKQEKESSVESSKEGSYSLQKPAQQSTQRAESSQSSRSESSKITERSTSLSQNPVTQENSQTSIQQTSSSPMTEESRAQISQTSQKTREQSKPELQSSKKSSQESKQSSSAPVQESSTASSEASEVSEETSYFAEQPTGRYIDGTYKAVTEVDGFEEEGFLYELEVTVTISGGKITTISGRIKNDRSEDPSSNEAYVRRAVKKLSDVIITNQDTSGVDVISNATYSSNAVLKAVSDALAQAER